MATSTFSEGWVLVRSDRPASVVAVGQGEWALRVPLESEIVVPAGLIAVLGWALGATEAIDIEGLRRNWLQSCEAAATPALPEPNWEQFQDVLIALQLFECRDAAGRIVELVDRRPRYVEERDLSGWEQSVRGLFEGHLFGLHIPAQGAIIELGTARGANFRRLCQHFGEARCTGYDVVNYARHPRVQETDVRELDARQLGPVALGFNDLSDWAQSPASKRAGFDFLVPNIVVGGYYVDATLTNELRQTLPLSDFEHLFDLDLFSVYRRQRAAEAR